jgi:hypothetical protein
MAQSRHNRAGGPLPVQVCTWNPRESGWDYVGEDEPSDPEWLYCLKDTRSGDRQVIWSGRDGSGIMSVVDFSGDVRRSTGRRGYEGWGRVTDLARPISVDETLSHPLLRTNSQSPFRACNLWGHKSVRP